MIGKPFKGMTFQNISQIFHEGHKGWDVVSTNPWYKNGYGTPLCAMEDIVIENIIGDAYTPHSNSNLKRGYGVWCTGLETGNIYVYWHTLPYLPVNEGDVVKRGQIIAYMGNAGQVFKGGVYVPLEERTVEPFNGTHLHLQIYEGNHPFAFIKGGEIDPMTLVDFTEEPNYTVADQIRSIGIVLKKMTTVLYR